MFKRLVCLIACITFLSVLSVSPGNGALGASEVKASTLVGDLNGDNRVNSLDYSLIKRFILNLIEDFPSSNGRWAADVDDDSLINSKDLSYIKKFVLGTIKAFPKQSGMDFVKVNGRELVKSSSNLPVTLRGVCFGNNVWSNPSFPTSYDHSEIDFTKVKLMNMNAIRFYMNYSLFEDDTSPYTYKQSGWDWLDQNISWARKNGIYLILNMHVPQGGYQSNGDGMALWDDPENQSRLVSLWKAIAERYKDEPVIAGYDILNEPVCSKSMDQWKGLANSIVKSIRSVDANHMLIVERMNGIKGDWTTYGNQNFFLIDDPNIMYTFHFYSPIEYTHQFTSWTSFKDQDGGKYPDPDIVNVPSDTTWADGTFSNPVLPLGDSDWKYYEGAKYRVTDPLIITGKPVIASDSNAGVSYFDDFIVKEYDANGDFLRTIYDTNINSRDGWDFWSKDGAGELALTSDEGHGDNKCLTLSKATADTNASYNKLRFKVERGHCYSISGWIKGKGVTSNSCRFRLDFEKSPSGSPAMARDKNYLESELKKMFSWGETNNVPIYVGEFGVFKSCFQNEKGGVQWVSDMLDIMNKYNVNYTYHDYHEDGFGIYGNSSGLPNEGSANTDLISLFKSHLSNLQ